MVAKIHYFLSGIRTARTGQGGFTLLELLVSMLLVSMVTVIVTQVFRLGINAWERAQEEGDSFQTRTVLPSLLGKQLDALVKEKSFAAGGPSAKLPFTGVAHGLSFFTTYSPMAGSREGLLRVTYLYAEKEKKLVLFQQLILTVEDLEDTRFPLSEEWDGSLEPSGEIHDVSRFYVRYSNEEGFRPMETETMDAVWDNEDPEAYPASILLEYGEGTGRYSSAEDVWHYNLGWNMAGE